MRKDSRMGRCGAIVLLAVFSLFLASCGGGGGGGTTTTTSYTVTATAGSGGSISPASVTVNSGATTSFTVTPDSGNSINTVTGCGGALVGSIYTTGTITAACTVAASFVSNGLPAVSIADASVAEGDSGTVSLNFIVTLSAPASASVDVDYATSDGSATASSDYTAISSGTLTITAGNTSGTVTVSVTGDTDVESNETLTLALSNPTGATLGTATATGTINNDDSASALPVISIADASVTEGDTGTTNLNFTVTLSALANGNLDVDFATSDNSPAAGSATAGSDYTASNGTLTIPAASTSATISVSVTGDTNVEGNETLTLTLSNPSGNATLGTATATGTILDDEITTRALNDTGITSCADDTANGLTCPQTTHPGQDAEYGRDATANDDSDGHAGFSFTKLDASGNSLSAAAVSWVCVQDNVTSLIWEVKTTDSGSRNNAYTYSWYNSTGVNDGGDPGTPNGGACVDSINCDTEKYVVTVNAVGLCGQNDWRLPTVDELISLVDSSLATTVDSAYFPNIAAQTSCYWSSSPYAYLSGNAWCVGYSYGYVGDQLKSFGGNVRLVRGGQ